MTVQEKIKLPEGLDLLRQPFAAHHISKLPKPTKAQTDEVKADFKKGIRCGECGSWHHPNVVHLDYVGHAALTDRLLDTDINWSWEPVAFTDQGLPAFDSGGGLWIKLTVCGVTRLGYGHAASKPNADPGSREKEVIGDALRNAAMRFGAALDLWHKGDLHPDLPDSEAAGGHSKESAVSPPPADPYTFPPGPAKGITELKALARSAWREVEGCGDEDMLAVYLDTDAAKALIAQMEALENPAHRQIWEGDGGDNPGLSGHIQRKRAELASLNA